MQLAKFIRFIPPPEASIINPYLRPRINKNPTVTGPANKLILKGV